MTSLEYFVRQSKSEDFEEAEAAASELTQFGEAAVPHMADALDRGVNPSEMAHGLVRLAGRDALALLVPHLRHPSDEVRFYVADALGMLGDRRAVQPLLEGLASEDLVENKGAYLTALGCLGDPRAVEALSEYVDYWDPGVAEEAVQALGYLGEPGTIAAVERALTRNDWRLQAAAKDALQALERGKSQSRSSEDGH